MTYKAAMKARILALCQQHNLTVHQLAKVSGVAESTLQRIVNGENHRIMIHTVEKLCDGFGITLAEFVDDDMFRNLEREVK